MLHTGSRLVLILGLTILATMCLGMGMASAVEVPLDFPESPDDGGVWSLNTVQITEKNLGAIEANQLLIVNLQAGSTYVSNPANASQAGKAAYFYIPTHVAQNDGKALVLNGLQPGDVVISPNSTDKSLVLKVLRRTHPKNPVVVNIILGSRITHDNPPLGRIVDGDSHVSIPGKDLEFKVSIHGASGPDTFEAHVLPAGTFAYALGPSYARVAPGEQKLGAFRIMENTEKALIPDGMKGAGTITLTLPHGCKWNTLEVTPSGGFTTIGKVKIDTAPSGCSRASFTVPSASVDNPGIIDISPVMTIDSSVQKGDIIAEVGGTNANVTPTRVIIGHLTEYGITCSSSGDTRIYSGCVDAKIGTLILHENCPGSLLEGRTLNLQLPSGCRWESCPVPVTTRGGCTLVGNGIISNGQIASYTVATASSGIESDIEFRQGTVSVPPGFPSGDFNVSFGGTAI